jgi:Protein of unknown function (DUF3563)
MPTIREFLRSVQSRIKRGRDEEQLYPAQTLDINDLERRMRCIADRRHAPSAVIAYGAERS